ncbi:hypothetical protein O6H91_Y057000 [Diphasiastrum complanatum]|nr:hypothetical protein O6H91_Y057000 [Diphasiastrum complanatum]
MLSLVSGVIIISVISVPRHSVVDYVVYWDRSWWWRLCFITQISTYEIV